MASSPKKQPAPQALDALEAGINQYLEWIAVHNFSSDTVLFAPLLSGLLPRLVPRARPGIANRDHAADPGALSALALSLPQEQRPAARLPHADTRACTALKAFFQWLARHNYLLHNPASELVLPRMEHRLPKYVLNAEEAEQVIQQPDIGQAEGLRDRAILETFYSTGMRRMELAQPEGLRSPTPIAAP